MLDNHDISGILNQYAKLLDLHNGNPFKVKSIASAAYNIKKIGEHLAELDEEALQKIPLLGKGLASKIYEINQTGSFEELNDLLLSTPKGVLDILNIKGLGPKKVEILWRTVGITDIPELLDACRENRLVEIKGFGYKTQAQIISDIEFKFNQEGKFHWAKMQAIVSLLNESFQSNASIKRFSVAGDYRRYNDIIESLDFVLIPLDISNPHFLKNIAESLANKDITYNPVPENSNTIQLLYNEVVRINLYCTELTNWGHLLLEKTATTAHLELINFNSLSSNYETEEQVYEALKLPYIIPELREGLNELKHLEQQNELITYKDLKGVLHNHTTYSDGLHTLSEMATHAQSMGLEYIGICDHSQSATYANGLKPERVLEQMKEIDTLNEKFAKNGSTFKILKGIESDILGDGNLDYSTDILRLFDIVVASIHSNLKMEMDKAHSRLIGAIENPYTTILGHPTGRLLLMRPGYPINHEYIIDACVSNGVAIELNAHPYRLDMDWRWIDYAINKGAMISINPDAHQKEGLSDMQYGVNVARKGYLTAANCLNGLSLLDFEKWIENKRK
ncbi:MAG: PHP domain-containing protein [Bacteroidetes bacterium]|nr:PHP domain-containing protein [Bacteroidota bacterium]